MALTTNPNVWKPMLVIFLVLTGIFGLLFYFERIFIVLTIGFIVIVLLERVLADYRRNSERFHVPRPFQKIYALLLIGAWLFAFSFLLVTSFQDLSSVFISLGQSQQDKIGESILRLHNAVPHILATTLFTEETLLKAQTYIFQLFTDVLSQLTFIIVEGFLIIPLLCYTYFTRKDEIWQFVYDSIPERFQEGFERASRDISRDLRGFLTARATENIIMGSIYCLGFYIAGVKGWLVLGMLAGFLNIVPYLGPILGGVSPLIVSLISHDITAAAITIMVILIAQTIDHFYLNTFMVPSKVNVDSLLSIVLVLISAQLFGILGMIFAVPVYLIYKVVLKESYVRLVEIYDTSVFD